MSTRNRTIASIDIGTNKITAVCGEIEDGGVTVIGCSTQPSYGVKKGVIINMDSTVDSIKRALDEVERMTGLDITVAVTGISGSHIKGISNTGVVPLSSREVKKADITSVLEAAKAVVIPTDREVIQIVPQEFVVDDQDGIKDPLGMSGVRLESRVYIVTGAVAAAQNVIRCMNRSGLKVQDIILQHFASAEAVLTDDEKELGCALVDIGGGTTDVAVFSQGCIRACSVLPIGGNHITSDIAIGIRTPLAEAEELKRTFGTACPDHVESDATIEIGCIGEPGRRTVSQRTLAQIINARVEETITLVQNELIAAGYGDELPAGIILTGGTALLRGIVDIAQKILGMPVRVGTPLRVRGLNDVKSPVYAAAVGLVQFAARGCMLEKTASKRMFGFLGVGERMRQWFAEAF
ncbi:MAG: cell division protein FtsA [Desulfobacterota bacterium]|nr:cell division protein FtsA [Thermodesulfobacteriota bacterium]